MQYLTKNIDSHLDSQKYGFKKIEYQKYQK